MKKLAVELPLDDTIVGQIVNQNATWKDRIIFSIIHP